MKTVFEKLIVRFEKMAQPAVGWLSAKSGETNRKTQRGSRSLTLSPESYNVRSTAARAQDRTRRNAAP